MTAAEMGKPAAFTEETFKMETVEGGMQLHSTGVEALDRENGTTKSKVKAKMFLKVRMQLHELP